MERRVLIAVFLSFLVLYVYQALVAPPPAPPDEPAGPAVTATAPAAPDGAPAPAPRQPDGAGAVGERLVPVETPAPQPVVADTEPREVVVESEAYRAVFSNRGAELISWQLKRYLQDGRPVELVPVDLPADEPWPFTLAFDDDALTAVAHNALYRASQTRIRVDDAAQTLSFDYEDRSGLRVRKQFVFDPAVSPYVVRVTVDAALGSEALAPVLRWGPALGGGDEAGTAYARRQGARGVLYGRWREGDVLGDLNVIRPDAQDIGGRPSYEGQATFAGVDNHYFVATAVTSQNLDVRYRAVSILPVADGEPRNLIAFDLAFGDRIVDVPFFLGPKDFDILAAADPELVRAIDFGFLSVLVVPLHRSLKWVHGWVGNYGWAIIIVTFFVNVVIFPLRHKSVVSMRRMSELQPEMKAIQDRYKHLKATDPDKQKMNQEVMALYRDRGVNPASGCLPMLLTMPILFAFYRLLSVAIELRDAPFVGWITDLSAPDPLYITPVIMGVSMVVQQRLNPSQPDATQQKIMMLMPVFFTFLFLRAPSGLVLYWLTSNVLGIAQQFATNRMIGPARRREVRPPAERRVNKARAAQAGAKSDE